MHSCFVLIKLQNNAIKEKYYRFASKIYSCSSKPSYALIIFSTVWALQRLKSANYRSQISRDPGPLFPGNGKPKNPGIPGNFPSRESRPTALTMNSMRGEILSLKSESVSDLKSHEFNEVNEAEVVIFHETLTQLRLAW